MKTWGLRLYGSYDMRLERFDLPPLREDEILVKMQTDSLCMSSYKLLKQGQQHRRVRWPLADCQPILGHEFCGDIVQVGSRWQGRFSEGDKFVIQTTFEVPEPWSPGYSCPFLGGRMSYGILPAKLMETEHLFPRKLAGYSPGSLTEPYGCVIGALKASYHTIPGSYQHQMNIKPGGSCCLLGGTGPMGQAMIDCLLSASVQPSLLVVVGRSAGRLERTERLASPERCEQTGTRVVFLANDQPEELVERLMKLNDGPYDDVLLFNTQQLLMEQSSRLLAFDGCLNVFAGPENRDCFVPVNFFDVHNHHFVGTSGGTSEDLRETLLIMERGKVAPGLLVTRVGGLRLPRLV